MSPISDYNLGRAHGRIVVDYDSRGTDAAQQEFAAVEQSAGSLESAFEKLRKFFNFFSSDFVGSSSKIAASLGFLSGGAAILLGMSSATGNLSGSLLKLRGGIKILGAVGILLGGVPKSISGFPNVIKKIVLLSAAITLFAGSSRLLDGVVRRIGKLIASSKVIGVLTNAFPALMGMFKKAVGFIPSLKEVGNAVDGIGKPVHQIARAALALGALISLFRTGMKTAVGMAKAMLKLGAGAVVIQGLVFVITGLIGAVKEVSGVLGLLPGVLVTAGLAGATFAVGMQGISKALKKVNASQTEFNAAIKNLAPSAQGALKSIRGFRDEWDQLRKTVQQQLFKDASNEIVSLGLIYLPILERQMSLVAAEINNMGAEFALFARRGETITGVNRLFEMTRVILHNLSKAIQPLLQAFLDIAIVSSEALAALSVDAGNAAEQFAKFIRNARETGQLRKWIEDGITGIARLIDIIYNLGRAFGIVFDAFSVSGDSLLLTLDRMTDSMLAFLQSAKGQEALNVVVDLIKTLSEATRAVFGAGLKELIPILVALMPLIKTLATTFSDVLVTAIQILGPLLQGLAQALSFLSPVLGPILGFFLAWSVAMTVLGAAVAIFVPVLGVLVKGIGLVTTVLRALGVAAMANPVIAILGLIALLAWLIIDNWDIIGPKLKAIWEWIASTAQSIWGAVTGFFIGIWTSVRDFFVGLWNGISSFAQGIWTGIADFFTGLWESVTGFFIDIWDKVAKSVTDSWQWIVDTFKFIWEPMASILESIISIIRDLLIIIFGGIAIAFIAIWNKLKDDTIAAWNLIKAGLKEVWDWILSVFHFIWDPLVEFFTWLWDIITTGTQAAWDFIGQMLSTAWTAILDFFHLLWDPIADFFTMIWTKITDVTKKTWDAIVSFLTGIWNGIKQQWETFWNAISSFFSDIWNSKIIKAVRDGVDGVLSWIGSIPGKVWDIVKDAGKWLLDAGKAIISGFLNGLKNAFKAVADWVGGIKDWIVDHKGPVRSDRKALIPAGEAFMNGLLQGFQSKEAMLQAYLRSLTVDIQNGLSGATDLLSNSATTIASAASVGIVTSIPSNAKTLASSVTPVQGAANGTLPALGFDAGAGARAIEIANLNLYVTGNLDPTDPVKWRGAMKEIQSGIRKVENENK